MNETEIKTRLGLILQGVFAEALTRAGYSYVMDPQYDPTCEKPDFLIPDDADPKYLVEVHQTEARNSFQMKTLRAFTAVAEGKAHYKNDMVSVNVLFGDPDKELPAANVKAMCSFFDVNILPRKDANKPSEIESIEKASLAAASTEGKSVKNGIDEVLAKHSGAINKLVQLVKPVLGSAIARSELYALWDMERKRTGALKKPPVGGDSTYYKRMMLRSLYLKDKDFDELQSTNGDPGLCSPSVQEQVIVTGLAELREELDGDYYDLDPEFKRFVEDPDSLRLRGLCKARLDAVPEMKWFFEDIRNAQRRIDMANRFCEVVAENRQTFCKAFRQSFENGNALGVAHERCWIADFMPLVVGVSHNYFNRAMFSHQDYSLRLGNPFNNIAIRSARLGKIEEELDLYQRIACDVFFDEIEKRGINLKELDSKALEESFLEFRLGAAIKLRKLDPLLLVSEELCARIGLSQEKVPVPSVVGDLSRSAAAGKFKAYKIGDNHGKFIMMNAVATHDNNGDHKSKEWGARRLATLYRYSKSGFKAGDYSSAIFVIDGDWLDKDVARLYRDGWDHICRLGDLEGELISMFGLKKKKNK